MCGATLLRQVSLEGWRTTSHLQTECETASPPHVNSNLIKPTIALESNPSLEATQSPDSTCRPDNYKEHLPSCGGVMPSENASSGGETADSAGNHLSLESRSSSCSSVLNSSSESVTSGSSDSGDEVPHSPACGGSTAQGSDTQPRGVCICGVLCDSGESRGGGGSCFVCLQSSLTLSIHPSTTNPDSVEHASSCDSTPRLCQPTTGDGWQAELQDAREGEEDVTPMEAVAAAAPEAAAAAVGAAESGAGSWDVALHLPLWISSNERIQIEERLEGWVDELFRVVGPEVQALSQVCICIRFGTGASSSLCG